MVKHGTQSAPSKLFQQSATMGINDKKEQQKSKLTGNAQKAFIAQFTHDNGDRVHIPDTLKDLGSVWLGDKVKWDDRISDFEDGTDSFSVWSKRDGTNPISVWLEG